MLFLPGIAAFGLFVIFDINKITWHKGIINVLFPLGGVLLVLSTVLCITASGRPEFSFFTVLAIAGAILSAAALVYALFFALPFKGTYKESSSLPLVNGGIYGMCRHPAFWPFLLVYVFLWLAFGGKALFGAMLTFPLCNLLYIIIQDKYIFPLYIEGYDSYRQSVPFLFPRRKG